MLLAHPSAANGRVACSAWASPFSASMPPSFSFRAPGGRFELALPRPERRPASAVTGSISPSFSSHARRAAALSVGAIVGQRARRHRTC